MDTSRAAALLRRAAGAAKCHPCGCAHHAAAAGVGGDDELVAAVAGLRESLLEQRYDCLGCRVCWPADALALLDVADPPPVSVPLTLRRKPAWPPLPGAYTVLRPEAPVAVCTLGDDRLAGAVVALRSPETAIVGTLATENHGIERLVRNVVANPALRFLVVAGAEVRGPVGHLPGASLVALADHGVDSTGRIVAAPGRRPILRNVSAEEVAAFRERVEVVDLIGETDAATIAGAAAALARRHPGAAPEPPRGGRPAAAPGYLAARMTPDPAGYFVVYVHWARRLLNLEHYDPAGVVDRVIEAATAAECYTPAIDAGLVTRLDHAAYLGRELARAESALQRGIAFVQDAAPELGDDALRGSAGEGAGERVERGPVLADP